MQSGWFHKIPRFRPSAIPRLKMVVFEFFKLPFISGLAISGFPISEISG
jgi:hypothetical protein